MASAAFAKVDPRLLEQNLGADKSEAITAAGDAIGGALQGLGDYHKAVGAKEKADKDNSWTDWKRGQEAQALFLKHQDQKTLGYGVDPGEFQPPPGYTVEGSNLIMKTETMNLADGIKDLQPKKDGDSENLIIKEDEYLRGDANADGKVDDLDKGIYGGKTGLNTIFGGGYGSGQRYKDRPEAITAIDGMAKATGRIPNLKSSLEKITNQPNFDAGGNERLVSLETALDNDAVHTVYNHKEKRPEYVWQDSKGKWNRMGSAGAIDANGKANLNIINDNKKITEAVTPEVVIDVLRTNKLTQNLMKDLIAGKPLVGIENLMSTLQVDLETYFKDSPDELASYIRNGEIVDPTPDDNVVTAADAASFTEGLIREDPRFKQTFEASRNYDPNRKKVDFQDPTKTLIELGTDVESEYTAKNATYFRDIGYKNARFNTDGDLVHDVVISIDNTGDETFETRKIENNTSTRHEIVRRLVGKNYNAGAEKTALLGAFSDLTSSIKKQEDAFAVEQEKKAKVAQAAEVLKNQKKITKYTPQQLQTVINASVGGNASLDVTTLTGLAGITSVEEDTIGDEFTVHLKGGKTLRVNPDILADVKTLQKLLSSHKFLNPNVDKLNF